MAQILAPGETLANGQVRTDESFRFHLAFQPDGNLVVYAHVIAPEVQRIAIGATDTNGLGANIHLHLNPGGWLEMLDNSNRRRRWFRPLRFSHRRGIVPWGVPNSTLHLQADGRLVLYRPGGFSSSNATWAIAGVNQPTEDVCVIPNALTIDVSDDGTLSSRFDKYVINDTNENIGVRDGHTFIALPPGQRAGVATPGTIAVDASTYMFREPGQPGSFDAIPARTYGPGEDVIRATGSSSGGFRLA